MALEEAGELQEAARVFEYAGEHAQAAILRLEHARTLRDPGDRMDVLREGCARNHVSTPEGRTLHLALAEALLAEAESTDDIAQRRGFELEAASALEEADEGGRAGELYESLGLLRKAGAAYERSGEVVRLELVLEVLERQEQRVESARALVREIDDAIAAGRRQWAWTLLVEHVRGGSVPGQSQALVRVSPGSESAAPVATAAPELVSRLQLLEHDLIRSERFSLAWSSDRATAVRLGPRIVLGRAPDADLPIADARLSRHHVELRLDVSGERPRLVAVDLGSRVGTFWQGDPLEPGEPCPLLESGELALGMSRSLQVDPVVNRDGAAMGGLVSTPGSERRLLFVPGGGPLWLAPDIRVPASVLLVRGVAVIDFAGPVGSTLAGKRLDAGANIELLAGDHICLVDAPLCMEVVR